MDANDSPAESDLLGLGEEAFRIAWETMSETTRAALPEGLRTSAYLRYLQLKMPGSDKKVLAELGREQYLAYSGASDLILGNNGQIKACEHNAKQLIAADPRYGGLHFDEFLYRIRIGDRDWNDNDDRVALCVRQARDRVPGFTLAQVRNAIAVIAYERKLDSLRNYVTGLPVWDGTPRIELAFHEAWGAPDTPLTRAASQNFFIALHARAVQPGAQVDTLWAFEGPQGKWKSKSLRALGRNFHAEISASIGTTDFQRELRGIWLAEMAELDSMRGREATTSKRLLSAPSDRFVEKYEKHAVAYPRRAVAMATTNEATYWQDSTGARRLVPITIGEIDIDMISNCRELWFAEARHLFDNGATWWEFPATIGAAQEERQQIDPWEDLLGGLIANGRSMTHGYDSITKQPLIENVRWPDGWISSAEIMRDWLKLAAHQQGQGSGVRLGRVMRRLGFIPQRQGKSRERGWAADAQDAK